MKSIIKNEKSCFICGTTRELHKHHIFHGTANRKLADKYGCWVYLCAYHHTGSDKAVHGKDGHDTDVWLKTICQEAWEAKFGGRDAFMEVFGRSYL